MSGSVRPSVARSNRREFLKRSSAAAGVAVAGAIPLARSVHAAGSDVIKIGLIGCGGRGSGAAANAMNAGPDVRLVAMGDIFEDRLTGARERLKKAKPDQVQVDDKQCFVGWDAYKKVLETDIQVVLIAAASHFHPQFFKAAVEAGKHIFCEKPHAVDVPGLKVAMAANELAKKKGLAVMSGLCWRHDPAVQETMKRVADGAIGDVLAIQENYLSSPYGLRVRQPEWNEMQYQMQNWYHFNWLSGDQTGQQLIHSIDKASWALGDKPPARAYGIGGRQVCLEPKYGDQYDHYGVVFEYADGVRVFGFCRDQPGVFNETADYIIGTKGRAYLPNKCRIDDVKGQTVWKYEYPKTKVSMYDCEHVALFASIRAGKPCNSGGYMFTSTMLGILAQMVCYTGQVITWEQAMNSTNVLAPSRYTWDAEPPVKPNPDGTYPTAMPGMTKFV
jgi:predicted dehydrogenase